jgi:hypothetical protein
MHQEHKETYIIILIIATGLFFVLILFLYLVYKQYQKNRGLFIEKLNAEYLGRGEERRRISKDLHDEWISNKIKDGWIYGEEKNTEQKMTKSIESLKSNLQKIRTGRAHPGILEQIYVDYYGNPTPLAQVANLGLADARTLTVQPYEKNMMGAVE